MRRGKSKNTDATKYVVEFSIHTTDFIRKALNARFYAARCFYNAILNECERRRRFMKTLPSHQEGLRYRKEMHTTNDKNKIKELDKQAKILFEQAKKEAGYYLHGSKQKGFTNDLESHGYKTLRYTWLREELDVQTCNELSYRAFSASEKVCYRKAKRVRFLRFLDFACIQGKNRNIKFKLKEEKLLIHWFGLLIPVIERAEDPYYQQIREKVEKDPDSILDIRILRRGNSFFAQVTCVGVPPAKGRYEGHGEIGIDASTASVYYVHENGEYGQEDICKQLKNISNLVRRYQRKLDRQRRQNNPHCYDEKGRFIKGTRLTNFSTRYQQTKRKLADLLRRQVERKKCLQGEIINRFRSKANVYKREEVEYNKWKERKQTKNGRKRTHGRSMQRSGVGGFMKRMDYRFSCGNQDGVVKINTYKTKYSQTCPVCLQRKKKTLEERTHQCQNCGFTWERDLTSSLLAVSTKKDGETLDHPKALDIIKTLEQKGAFTKLLPQSRRKTTSCEGELQQKL